MCVHHLEKLEMALEPLIVSVSNYDLIVLFYSPRYVAEARYSRTPNFAVDESVIILWPKPVVAGGFLHPMVDPSMAWADAVEHPCTIQVFRIAATEDIQVLKAAAPTGITRDRNIAIGSAGNFSRYMAMKSRRRKLIHLWELFFQVTAADLLSGWSWRTLQNYA